MKVLHLVAGELTGGAARGAYWLHQGLRSLGVDSRVYTNSQQTHGDTSVVSVSRSKKDKIISIARSQADQAFASVYRKRQSGMFSAGVPAAGSRQRTGHINYFERRPTEDRGQPGVAEPA